MKPCIDHINISVTNLDVSTSFFVDHFGFEIQDKQHLSGKWLDDVVGLSGVDATYVQLSLPETETKLELIEYHHPKGIEEDSVGHSNAIGFRHIAIAVVDIEHNVEQLLSSGINCFSEIQDYKTKKLVYCQGPDAIIVELAQYK